MNQSGALRPPKPHQIYQPPAREDDNLSRYIGISIAFHLFLLTIFTVRAFFFSSEPMMLDRAIRVDIVGLPDKKMELPKPAAPPAPAPEVKKPEPPKAAEAPKPVEPVKPPPKPALPVKPVAPKIDPNKISLEKSKQAQESALKRLEALNRVEKMVSESKKAEAAKAAAAAAAQQQQVKGNELSKGSALTGLSKLENDDYLTTLDQHVKQNWNLPNFLAKANLSASAVVFLDENGNVTKKVLVKTSGNEIFDQSVLSAIDRSSPFPKPPKRLVGIFATEGLQLGFPD